MRILIVEDDKRIINSLTRLLKRESYVVDAVESISQAMHILSVVKYAAVILDRGLDDGDGLNVVSLAHSSLKPEQLPCFIILSALSEPIDRVEGLNAGAVDYIAKPYEPAELLARLKICTSRNFIPVEHIISLGNVDYDTQGRTLKIDNTPIQVRRREQLIIELLLKNKGRVITHETIESQIYNFDEEIESNAVSSQISRLRRILKKANANITIKVMRHIGYYLEEISL